MIKASAVVAEPDIVQIFSPTQEGLLLACVYRGERFRSQLQAAVDLTPETEYLQVRPMRVVAGKTYPAHKHLPQLRTTHTTQECLILMQGSMEADIFDVDDRRLQTLTLGRGDCLVTLAGGHGFRILEDDTLVYEIKNGPYNGPLRCKTMIESKG